MSPELRIIEVDEAEEFAKENEILYMETSAVSDTNVEDAFVTLLQEIYYNVNAKEPEGFNLSAANFDKEREDESKQDCC